MKALLAFALLISLFVQSALAFVTSATTPTYYYTNGTVADINSAATAVNPAGGDRIEVPALTTATTWTGIVLPNACILEGQNTLTNSTNTMVTAGSGTIISIQSASIVQHIRLVWSVNLSAVFSMNSSANWFRVSDVVWNHENMTSSNAPNFASIGTALGLIDNCEFNGLSGNNEMVFTRGPTAAWQNPDPAGTNNVVKLENDTIGGTGYVSDFNADGVAVCDFNDIPTNIKFDWHGYASDSLPNRGCRWGELYRNQFDISTTSGLLLEFRGGTGRIFDNSAPNTTGGALMGWYVAEDYGMLGNFPLYANANVNPGPPYYRTPTDFTWPDMIGIGQDTPSYPLQIRGSDPEYVWNNTIKSAANWVPLYKPPFPGGTYTMDAAGYSLGANTINMVSVSDTSYIGDIWISPVASDHTFYTITTANVVPTSQLVLHITPGLQVAIPATAGQKWTGGAQVAYAYRINTYGATWSAASFPLEGTDFFMTPATTFNGSDGVGRGPYSATSGITFSKVGVGYCATDQGQDWQPTPANSRGVILSSVTKSGILYTWNGTALVPVYMPNIYPDTRVVGRMVASSRLHGQCVRVFIP